MTWAWTNRVVITVDKLRGLQRTGAAAGTTVSCRCVEVEWRNIAKAVDNSARRVRGYILVKVERAAKTAQPGRYVCALRLLEVAR